MKTETVSNKDDTELEKIIEDYSRNEDYISWCLLHQARDAIFAAWEKELRQYGISPSEACVLFIIHSLGDSSTLTEISHWRFRQPHSISNLVTRMEKRGLVKKFVYLDRKNVVRVAMTEKGEKAFSKAAKWQSLHEIFSVLSSEQRRQLMAYTRALRDSAVVNVGMERNMPFPPESASAPSLDSLAQT